MFILELTLRSWNHSEENKRRTLQRNDIAAAITRTDIFDFLVRSLCMDVLLNSSCFQQYMQHHGVLWVSKSLQDWLPGFSSSETHSSELVGLSCLDLA